MLHLARITAFTLGATAFGDRRTVGLFFPAGRFAMTRLGFHVSFREDVSDDSETSRFKRKTAREPIGFQMRMDFDGLRFDLGQ